MLFLSKTLRSTQLKAKNGKKNFLSLKQTTPAFTMAITGQIRTKSTLEERRQVRQNRKQRRDKSIQEQKEANPVLFQLNGELLESIIKGDEAKMENTFEQLKEKTQPNVVTYDSLIRGYSKFNNFDKAQKIWKELSIKSPKISNTYFGTCAKLGQFEEAEKLLEEMNRNNIPIYSVTGIISLSAHYINLGEISKAIDLITQKSVKNFDLLTAIRAQRRLGNNDACRALCREVLDNPKSYPDLPPSLLYTELLLSTADWDKRMNVLEEIEKKSVRLSDITVNWLFSQLRSSKPYDQNTLDLGMRMLKFVSDQKLQFNTFTFDWLLETAIELNADVKTLCEITNFHLKQESQGPTSNTIKIWKNYLEKQGKDVGELFEVLRSGGAFVSAEMYSRALYAAASLKDQAMFDSIVNAIAKEDVSDTVAIKLAKLRFYTDTQQKDAAFELLKEMKASQEFEVLQNENAEKDFTLGVHAAVGELNEVDRLLEEAKSKGFRVLRKSYSHLIQTLARLGKHEDAMKYCEEVLALKIRSAPIVDTIYSILKKDKGVEAATDRILEILKEEQGVPSTTCLSRMFKDLQEKKDLKKVWDVFDGLMKSPYVPRMKDVVMVSLFYRDFNPQQKRLVKEWITNAGLPIIPLFRRAYGDKAEGEE